MKKLLLLCLSAFTINACDLFKSHSAENLDSNTVAKVGDETYIRKSSYNAKTLKKIAELQKFDQAFDFKDFDKGFDDYMAIYLMSAYAKKELKDTDEYKTVVKDLKAQEEALKNNDMAGNYLKKQLQEQFEAEDKNVPDYLEMVKDLSLAKVTRDYIKANNIDEKKFIADLKSDYKIQKNETVIDEIKKQFAKDFE